MQAASTAHFTANFTPIVVVNGLGLGGDIPILYVTAGLSFITILVIWAAGGFAPQTRQAERQRLGGLDQRVGVAK